MHICALICALTHRHTHAHAHTRTHTRTRTPRHPDTQTAHRQPFRALDPRANGQINPLLWDSDAVRSTACDMRTVRYGQVAWNAVKRTAIAQETAGPEGQRGTPSTPSPLSTCLRLFPLGASAGHRHATLTSTYTAQPVRHPPARPKAQGRVLRVPFPCSTHPPALPALRRRQVKARQRVQNQSDLRRRDASGALHSYGHPRSHARQHDSAGACGAALVRKARCAGAAWIRMARLVWNARKGPRGTPRY